MSESVVLLSTLTTSIAVQAPVMPIVVGESPIARDWEAACALNTAVTMTSPIELEDTTA